MTRRIRSLVAAHAPRQQRLQAGANGAANAVDAAIRRLWVQLQRTLVDSEGSGPATAALRALPLLRSLSLVIVTSLRTQLASLFYRGHSAAVLTIRDTVPVRQLERVRPLPLHERRRDDPRPDPDPDELRRLALLDLLFQPPPADRVLSWLDQFVHPAGWNEIGGDTVKRLPEDLASQIASDFALGRTPQEIAAVLLPYFEGSRVRARRTARTFGQHVSHAGQQEAWNGLGDMVIGYEIHAVHGNPWTRPWHRERDGTVYYRDPAPGQKGFYQLPHPPLEADDPAERPPKAPQIAWCCLCWLSPLLGD